MFFLFIFCIFGVQDMKFIYMAIVKKIVFTCVIYAITVYHQIERVIPNVCATLVLL